jgi:1-acyl-sn-glycerol-3-phosphate acyltransferase
MANLQPQPKELQSKQQTTPQQRLARTLTRLMGWKVEIAQQPPDKCVIIGAHHTSNWDFFAALALKFSSNLKINFLMKDSLFYGPLGWMANHLGGIPVNRGMRTNLVDQITELFKRSPVLRIAISPEGTRKQTTHWKTGFYYIALGAKVPIVMGYVDYLRKIVGLGPELLPSGDIHADFTIIQDFYRSVTARYPHKASQVALLKP